MESDPKKPRRHPLGRGWSTLPGKERIEALSDGVFSIVITLLAFNLKAPELPDGLADGEVGRHLLSHLLALRPQFSAFLFTFVLTGVYWNAHRNAFALIRRSDQTLTWLNTLFLLGVAVIPFPASLLGRYPGNPVALAVYGATLTFVGLTLFAVWEYGVGGGRLTEEAATARPEFTRLGRGVFLVAPTAYLTATLLSFRAPWVSQGIYAVVPFLFIFRGWIDRRVEKALARLEESSAAPEPGDHPPSV